MVIRGSSYHRLIARDSEDDGSKSIGAGGIAGIIIGIVIVAGILLALLIWRLYTFRTNRDFFTGRTNLNYASNTSVRLIPEKPGHVRSTRTARGRVGYTTGYDGEDARESVLEMEGNVDRAGSEGHYGDHDEKRLIEQRQHLTHAVQINQQEWEQRRQERVSEEEEGAEEEEEGERKLKSKERYPSETNRSSWWWPSYGKADESQVASSSATAAIDDGQITSQDAQSEVMQQR